MPSLVCAGLARSTAGDESLLVVPGPALRWISLDVRCDLQRVVSPAGRRRSLPPDWERRMSSAAEQSATAPPEACTESGLTAPPTSGVIPHRPGAHHFAFVYPLAEFEGAKLATTDGVGWIKSSAEWAALYPRIARSLETPTPRGTHNRHMTEAKSDGQTTLATARSIVCCRTPWMNRAWSAK